MNGLYDYLFLEQVPVTNSFSVLPNHNNQT